MSATAFDVSVVVTARDQTVVAGPTMHSVEASSRAAEEAGYRVERLVAFDGATAECRAFFDQPAFAAWRKEDVTSGDGGSARVAAVAATRGRWVSFVTAHDLVSENWLPEAARRLAAAESAGEQLIVHPEFNWVFDAAAALVVSPAQDDPLFSRYFLYFGDYYAPLALAPRTAYASVPQQDWQWDVETIDGGWRHAVVRDSILFSRRLHDSTLAGAGERELLTHRLEGLAIDRIGRLGERRAPAAAAAAPSAAPAAGRSEARQIAAWAARGRFRTIREYRALARTSAFDEAYYTRTYRDVAQSGMSPLAHFVAHGAWEGRNPNASFDTRAYLERHPELAAGRRNPLLHWLRGGAA